MRFVDLPELEPHTPHPGYTLLPVCSPRMPHWTENGVTYVLDWRRGHLGAIDAVAEIGKSRCQCDG